MKFQIKQKRHSTYFLFPVPSFWSGAESIMNLAGDLSSLNSSDTGFEADRKAIENDFRMIGQDISDVLGKIKEDKNLLFSSM